MRTCRLHLAAKILIPNKCVYASRTGIPTGALYRRTFKQFFAFAKQNPIAAEVFSEFSPLVMCILYISRYSLYIEKYGIFSSTCESSIYIRIFNRKHLKKGGK